MPKIVEEQKKKSDKSAFADIFHMYLAVLSVKFDQSNLPLLTRCSRNPSQPFTISLYVISKSPVYHGSAIFPGAIGIIQQKTHFMLRVTPENPKHISPISLFHCDQIIIFIIVRFLKLNCSFPSQEIPCLASSFFAGGYTGFPIPFQIPLYSLQQMQYRNPTVVVFVDHILKYKFCHRGTADIAVADK